MGWKRKWRALALVRLFTWHKHRVFAVWLGYDNKVCFPWKVVVLRGRRWKIYNDKVVHLRAFYFLLKLFCFFFSQCIPNARGKAYCVTRLMSKHAQRSCNCVLVLRCHFNTLWFIWISTCICQWFTRIWHKNPHKGTWWLCPERQCLWRRCFLCTVVQCWNLFLQFMFLYF